MVYPGPRQLLAKQLARLANLPAIHGLPGFYAANRLAGCEHTRPGGTVYCAQLDSRGGDNDLDRQAHQLAYLSLGRGNCRLNSFTSLLNLLSILSSLRCFIDSA